MLIGQEAGDHRDRKGSAHVIEKSVDNRWSRLRQQGLYIEPEVDDVPVPHFIVLPSSLRSPLSLAARGFLRDETLVVYNSALMNPLHVRMNLSRCLRHRSPRYVHASPHLTT